MQQGANLMKMLHLISNVIVYINRRKGLLYLNGQKIALAQ